MRHLRSLSYIPWFHSFDPARHCTEKRDRERKEFRDKPMRGHYLIDLFDEITKLFPDNLTR
jgi:hypothetical protein